MNQKSMIQALEIFFMVMCGKKKKKKKRRLANQEKSFPQKGGKWFVTRGAIIPNRF